MEPRSICILGGTGFVGTHLANQLTKEGWRLRVPTRRRERNRHLLVMPTLELNQADIHDPVQLTEQLSGCDAVINLVGILNERGDDGSGFHHVHTELAQKIVDACKKTGVRRLLQMSALNADADSGASHYLKSKGEAERIVRQADEQGLRTTIFRPSVIFGPGDDFFNRFAKLLKLIPFYFPLTCFQARFAPVYVGDVAAAFVKTLDMPSAAGECYSLCGPRQYLLQEVVEYTARTLGISRRILSISDERSRRLADWLERVPGKPFSRDNYRSLQIDSVCRGENGLARLGIDPVAVEAVVPEYLNSGSQRGRFYLYRGAARRE